MNKEQKDQGIVPDDVIREALLQAMREQGYTTYIDFDGVEKPL